MQSVAVKLIKNMRQYFGGDSSAGIFNMNNIIFTAIFQPNKNLALTGFLYIVKRVLKQVEDSVNYKQPFTSKLKV